jgi:hypothetical protein
MGCEVYVSGGAHAWPLQNCRCRCMRSSGRIPSLNGTARYCARTAEGVVSRSAMRASLSAWCCLLLMVDSARSACLALRAVHSALRCCTLSRPACVHLKPETSTHPVTSRAVWCLLTREVHYLLEDGLHSA